MRIAKHHQRLYHFQSSQSLVETGETRDILSMGVKRNTQAYGVLEGQPEGMRSLGRSRHRKEHNINSDNKSK